MTDSRGDFKSRGFSVELLGETPYLEALELQQRLVRARKSEEIPDTLLLLTHPNVITLGRASSVRFLKTSESELLKLGYPVVEAGRGGETTFHGPDQLILYPILKLQAKEQDLHRYLRNLEEVGIGVCRALGLKGERCEGRTGVWVEGRKVAAIGVRASSWVTYHGMAINRGDDLRGFDYIVPCGIADAGVASLEGLLQKAVSTAELETLVTQEFSRVFGVPYQTSKLTTVTELPTR